MYQYGGLDTRTQILNYLDIIYIFHCLLILEQIYKKTRHKRKYSGDNGQPYMYNGRTATILWLQMIGVDNPCPLGMFTWYAVKVIDSKECDIEPAHSIQELEERHVERACVECNPLYAFTGKQAVEQKVLE